MPYTRALKYKLPFVRGEDVLSVQLRLRELGYAAVGQPDGVFGGRTEAAVKDFQRSRGLKEDGIVGPVTWSTLFEEATIDFSEDKIASVLKDLCSPHTYRNSVAWQLSRNGLGISKKEPETTGGEPVTVRRVWQSFAPSIEQWGGMFQVPVELIVATICTETRGDPSAVREEPGYLSDAQTPNKVSPGLMQTLISTARDTLGDESIDRAWLLEPGNSIRAGTAYIASQWRATHYDPPKVACAYNAGGIYHNDSAGNRWKMRQYPINTGEHADRFVQWFNDCFLMFERDKIEAPEVSLFSLLHA